MSRRSSGRIYRLALSRSLFRGLEISGLITQVKGSSFDLSVSSICGHNNARGRGLTFKNFERSRYGVGAKETLTMSYGNRIDFQPEFINEIVF
jgi:hypothetical protein